LNNFAKYFFDNVDTEVLIKEQLKEQLKDLNEIILFNDDVNTFDWVIESLVEICDHDPLQAEQCAVIVHYKGKCGVKTGEYHELEPMCSALLERGLSAEIA
jgi:ATP-dependent Clp protease adaptor protein ClpS